MSTNRENAFLLSKDSDKINSAQSIIVSRNLQRLWDGHRFEPTNLVAPSFDFSGDLDFGDGNIYRNARIIASNYSTIPTNTVSVGGISTDTVSVGTIIATQVQNIERRGF